MPSALIIGAARGSGRAMARQYLADSWRTSATALDNGKFMNYNDATIPW